jgi:transposase-like protein
MRYTMEEKLAHLKNAEACIENRRGTYTSYAREHGIARTTFHQWTQLFDSSKPVKDCTQKTSLVNLGRPMMPITEKQKFVVDYYGSRIEVSSTDNLVELLKGIKRASAI